MTEYTDIEADVFEAMMELIRPQLAEDEQYEDVAAGISYLANRRAEVLRRPLITHLDVLFVCISFTWWRFKHYAPLSYEDVILRIRRDAFRGVSLGDTDRLDQAVPIATLALSLESLHWIMMAGDAHTIFRENGQDQ